MPPGIHTVSPHGASTMQVRSTWLTVRCKVSKATTGGPGPCWKQCEDALQLRVEKKVGWKGVLQFRGQKPCRSCRTGRPHRNSTIKWQGYCIAGLQDLQVASVVVSCLQRLGLPPRSARSKASLRSLVVQVVQMPWPAKTNARLSPGTKNRKKRW